jgi:hypothetical protein
MQPLIELGQRRIVFPDSMIGNDLGPLNDEEE